MFQLCYLDIKYTEFQINVVFVTNVLISNGKVPVRWYSIKYRLMCLPVSESVGILSDTSLIRGAYYMQMNTACIPDIWRDLSNTLVVNLLLCVEFNEVSNCIILYLAVFL